jgi:hypothetical protein
VPLFDRSASWPCGRSQLAACVAQILRPPTGHILDFGGHAPPTTSSIGTPASLASRKAILSDGRLDRATAWRIDWYGIPVASASLRSEPKSSCKYLMAA